MERDHEVLITKEALTELYRGYYTLIALSDAGLIDDNTKAYKYAIKSWLDDINRKNPDIADFKSMYDFGEFCSTIPV